MEFPIARAFLALALTASLPMPALAAGATHRGVITVDGRTFETWSDYVGSDHFRAYGKRCGTPPLSERPLFEGKVLDGSPGDCTETSTNPTADYDPGPVYVIPVVVHIIQSTDGRGQISDQAVRSQIEVLNEDFMAMAGSPGGNGRVVGIRFELATRDPSGNPTSGILRHTNDAWFEDADEGYTDNAWDTSRYLNIYTNEAGGSLGYVPAFPQSGIVGTQWDRVVILWSTFGRNAPIGPPHDRGRTVTHEVGHWLALEHTFNGGCASAGAPGCYTDGDLICDTNPEAEEGWGCDPSSASCGLPDPIDNYMNYTDDTCMERFTVEQIRRMRCSLEFYRPDVFSVASSADHVYWLDTAAHLQGQLGSQWRTDVAARNTGPAPATVELVLHSDSGDRTLGNTVPAGGQGVFEDLVGLMGFEGKGSLEVRSDQPLMVSGRIYNQASQGTFGQYLEAYPQGDGLAAGQSGWLLQLRQLDGAFRTNLSLTNTGTSQAQVQVRLFDASGAQLIQYEISLGAGQLVQDTEPFRRRANRPDLGWGFAEVRVTSGSGVLASASVVDSVTNDATTVPFKR